MVQGDQESGFASERRRVVGEIVAGEILISRSELEEVLIRVRPKSSFVLCSEVILSMSSALGNDIGVNQLLVVVLGMDFSVVFVNHVALSVRELLSQVLIKEVLISSYSVSCGSGKGVGLENFKLRIGDSLGALNVGSEFKEILEVCSIISINGQASQRGVSVVTLLEKSLSHLLV